jgi:hypothetical protein
VRKLVNTKPHMIKVSIIYLSEEYKCVQVHKHNAAHDKNKNILRKIKNIYQKRNASAQVCKHKAAHDKK